MTDRLFHVMLSCQGCCNIFSYINEGETSEELLKRATAKFVAHKCEEMRTELWSKVQIEKAKAEMLSK